jgi:membrane-bound ClpP family serine protease
MRTGLLRDHPRHSHAFSLSRFMEDADAALSHEPVALTFWLCFTYYLAMYWFKRLFNKQSQPLVQTVSDSPQSGLIGQIARAVTPLRTSGFIELDGTRYEVISNKGFVPVDALVRITGKRMGWWTVEPVD